MNFSITCSGTWTNKNLVVISSCFCQGHTICFICKTSTKLKFSSFSAKSFSEIFFYLMAFIALFVQLPLLIIFHFYFLFSILDNNIQTHVNELIIIMIFFSLTRQFSSYTATLSDQPDSRKKFMLLKERVPFLENYFLLKTHWFLE